LRSLSAIFSRTQVEGGHWASAMSVGLGRKAAPWRCSRMSLLMGEGNGQMGNIRAVCYSRRSSRAADAAQSAFAERDFRIGAE